MKAPVRNTLSVIAGWLGGTAVNMGLITMGHRVFPIPGVDHSDMDAMAGAMPTLDAQYFIFPFLAHALGTFVGAMLAGLIAATHKMKFSIAVGGLFLLGGIIANYMLPGPVWFAVVDLVLAYIPMAWLGGRVGMTMGK